MLCADRDFPYPLVTGIMARAQVSAQCPEKSTAELSGEALYKWRPGGNGPGEVPASHSGLRVNASPRGGRPPLLHAALAVPRGRIEKVH
jgi:hypothetical protein